MLFGIPAVMHCYIWTELNTSTIMRAFALLVFITGMICSATGQSDSRSLVVAHQTEYRPYCYIDSSGNSAGLLIDWWKLWAGKVDRTVTFMSGSIEECVEWVQSGEADAVAGMLIEEHQLDSLLYGELIIRIRSTLFLRDDVQPRHIYDLSDSIGILASAPSKASLQGMYPHLKFKPYKTTRTLLNAVEDLSLAGFFYDLPGLLGESPTPGKDLISGYSKYLDARADALRPAVRFDAGALRALLVKGTSQITSEELGALANDYKLIVRDTASSRSNTEVILFWLAIVLLAATLVFMFFQRKRYRTPEATKQKDWSAVIRSGESNKVEFKSSLRWDHRQGEVNKTLEYVIVKSISAFMNTDGGTLIIGVDDQGEVLGLDKDYTSVFKENADGFLLVLTNLINKHFGKAAHRLVKANIVSLSGKDICIVQILRSTNPVFLKKGENEEFYVRTSAASVPLGMSDSAEYIRNHFT